MEHFAHRSTKCQTKNKNKENTAFLFSIHHVAFRQRAWKDCDRDEPSFTQETTTSGEEKDPVHLPGDEESCRVQTNRYERALNTFPTSNDTYLHHGNKRCLLHIIFWHCGLICMLFFSARGGSLNSARQHRWPTGTTGRKGGRAPKKPWPNPACQRHKEWQESKFTGRQLLLQHALFLWPAYSSLLEAGPASCQIVSDVPGVPGGSIFYVESPPNIPGESLIRRRTFWQQVKIINVQIAEFQTSSSWNLNLGTVL